MINPDHYRVISFQHIDDYRCFQPLSASLNDGCEADDQSQDTSEELEILRNDLRNLFLDAGWEGDGTIECTFLAPPFSRSGYSNCEIIYHVKQSNNGTSWLAIPRNLEVRNPKDMFDD